MTKWNWRREGIEESIFYEDWRQFWQDCRKPFSWLLAIIGLAATAALVMIFSEGWPF